MGIPYTYRITHLPSGKHYYGARYAKNCHPDDLWVKYFTSSKTVKKLIEQDGKDAFFVEVRKVFETPEECVAWEVEVLRRLRVSSNQNWLNVSVIGSPTKDMLEKSMLNKYGVTNCMLLPEFKSKVRATNLERYGVPVAAMLPETQEKARNTRLRLYGVEYGINNPEIRNKMEETNIERYGVPNVFQSPDVKSTIRQSNIEKYGAPYPQQNKEWMDKFIDDLMCKKGKTRYVPPSYSSDDLTPAQKRVETNTEKFGAENVFASEYGLAKRKQSMIERYGVCESMQSPEIRAKSEESCMSRFGVRTYLMTDECNRKLQEWWTNAPIMKCSKCGFESNHPGVMSRYHNDNCTWIKVECVESGEVFNNSKELLSFIRNLSSKAKVQVVVRVCSGNRHNKTAYGYHWCYAEPVDTQQDKDV